MSISLDDEKKNKMNSDPDKSPRSIMYSVDDLTTLNVSCECATNFQIVNVKIFTKVNIFIMKKDTNYNVYKIFKFTTEIPSHPTVTLKALTSIFDEAHV